MVGMQTEARRLLVPLIHRFWPSCGPGGLVDFVLSKALDADAENTVHVTRYLDVMEVLERDDDFSVRIYDEKMTSTTGPFFLGMNDKALYDRDAAVIWRALQKTDEEIARRIAAEETKIALDRVRNSGRVDIVRDLVEKAVIRFVMRYFGTPVPEPERLLRLYQTTSKYLFAFWSDPVMRNEAVAAGETLKELLSSIVAERKRSPVDVDDVLGRFVAMPSGFADGDAGIVRSLAGLASGAINAPLGLFVYSVDTLLALPDPELEAVRKLATMALAGDQNARDRFFDYVREAQRFNVYPPFSYRYAERDARIAVGTAREKQIPKGATVVTWQSLALFDDEVFDRPFDFVAGRPRGQYGGFGHARHRCVGEHIGQAVIYEMALGLFTLPGIVRAPNKAGRVQNLSVRQGKYPHTFTAEFGRS
jgi:cytochrome P450